MPHAASLRSTVLLLVACTLAAACGADQRPPDAAPAAASTDADGETAANDGACAAGDAACVEAEHLGELVARYEAAVETRVDASAAMCWSADRETFRTSLAACTDADCRVQAQLRRLAVLDYLQPGATRVDRDLPAEPALIAVLGPDPDSPGGNAAAPATFDARGALVHAADDPEHMGIAVRAADGRQHVFIHDMFIDADAGQAELLGLLEGGARRDVHVRGHALAAPTGVPNFDTNRCRWVYLLP